MSLDDGTDASLVDSKILQDRPGRRFNGCQRNQQVETSRLLLAFERAVCDRLDDSLGVVGETGIRLTAAASFVGCPAESGRIHSKPSDDLGDGSGGARSGKEVETVGAVRSGPHRRRT